MDNEQPDVPVADASRCRSWCFTWNNYPAAYQPVLDQLDVRYLCVGEEIAPGTGTPHLQGNFD